MIELSSSPIDTVTLLKHVSHPEAGGQVLFVGTTRERTYPSTVGSALETTPASDYPTQTAYLVYEAYEEMARDQLQRLIAQAKLRWPLRAIAIAHRLGKVMPEEASIAIAVSSPHRHEAFEAARWLIDVIKQDVPIWKQEHYLDGPAQWIHPTSSPDPSESSPSGSKICASSTSRQPCDGNQP